MNKQLVTLAQKPMTRKEFLATLGLGVVTVAGFGSVAKLLKGDASADSNSQKYTARDYSSGAYGR